MNICLKSFASINANKSFLFVFISTKSFSQTNSNLYVSPGISFGYTIGTGINYGIEIDIGLLNYNYESFPIKSGFSLSKYWTHTKEDVHRHRTISIMTESFYFDFKMGYGNVKNPWGHGGTRNACREKGMFFDLNVTGRKGFIPWLGYKVFIYKKRNWAWHNKNYHSVFLKYKYDFTQKSNLKAY